MNHTIIIETQSDSVFKQVKEFAQRIGARFSEQHTDVDTADVDTADVDTALQEEALKKFTGSWDGDETGDELVEIIYKARNDQPRDIEL